MYNRDRSAIEACLSLPEVILQIGTYLFEPSDLYAASCVNSLWRATLLPVRSQFPHVTLEHLPSFLSFLESNRRAAHHIRALRILSDDIDKQEDSNQEDAEQGIEQESHRDFNADSDVEMDRDGDTSATSNTGMIGSKKGGEDYEDRIKYASDIMNHLADRGRLQFFMYALPGEPHAPLSDGVWLALQRMSETLKGLYVELVVRHWNTCLSSRFSNLIYLRLFLDSDEVIPTDPAKGAIEPRSALLSFLQSHPRLEVLHLYLGTCFTNLDLSAVHLPCLRSFLLISKAEAVNISPFVVSHPTLRSLDIYTDTDLAPFPADSLPIISALQVSAMTVSWFSNIIDTGAKREQPIRHLQITAARQENFDDVLRRTAPLGASLRCLELIFWSRDVPLLTVLKNVNRAFPKLVELSLFIPSWGSAEWEEEDKPVELTSMLQCFSQSNDLLAFSVSDSKTELMTEEEVQAVPTSCIPPRLRYIIWRARTFRLHRLPPSTITEAENATFRVERTYHPRNFRGSRFLRDWHEEMVLDHHAGNYEEQLRLPTDPLL